VGDRSNQMHSMSSLNGGQQAGRIPTQRIGGQFGLPSWSRWVFRPEGQARPAAAEILQLSAGPDLPRQGRLCDSDDRGWLWIRPQFVIPPGLFAAQPPFSRSRRLAMSESAGGFHRMLLSVGIPTGSLSNDRRSGWATRPVLPDAAASF
jgi:hypothetical protein